MFVEVVRRRSLAAVARDLGLTPSTISRGIAGLEQEVGVRLLHRTTRRLAPTEAGLAYFERLAPLVDELESARSVARDSLEEPSGTLRITAPVTFAQLNLMPLLPAFAVRYPQLRFEFLLTDSKVDLVAERLDAAVRLGHLEDSAMIAHRLCTMRYAVVASPDYLERHPAPRAPADLAGHDCLRYAIPGARAVWRFRDRHGATEDVPVAGRFTMSNGVALRQCAVAGLGLSLLPRWNVAEEIAEGTLVPVLERYDCSLTDFDAAAWVLYPSREYVPLKVRAWVDLLRAAFRHGAPNELALARRTPARRVPLRRSRGS